MGSEVASQKGEIHAIRSTVDSTARDIGDMRSMLAQSLGRQQTPPVEEDSPFFRATLTADMHDRFIRCFGISTARADMKQLKTDVQGRNFGYTEWWSRAGGCKSVAQWGAKITQLPGGDDADKQSMLADKVAIGNYLFSHLQANGEISPNELQAHP
eukprot:1327381-Pyramimonas_sp.AAC.1